MNLFAQKTERLFKGARKKLREKGIDNPEPVNPATGMAIIEGALWEQREEILEIWEELLAAAMDPKRQKFVRRSYIEIVKKLDPVDVLIFGHLTETQDLSSNIVHQISRNSGEDCHTVRVSLSNLLDLDLAEDHGNNLNGSRTYATIFLSFKGLELKKIISE